MVNLFHVNFQIYRPFRFRSWMKILILGNYGQLGPIKGSKFGFFAFENTTTVIAAKFYTRLMV